MKPALIFCGGPMDSYDIWSADKREDYLIICADGGMRHARHYGILPDIVIGDLDSAKFSIPESVPKMVYPPEKDETDCALCLDYAISQGCKEVLILGAMGGRLDHEYSVYPLLLYGLNRGVRVTTANSQNIIFMENKPFTVPRRNDWYISFFPYGGDVEGFTVKGLKYKAENLLLTCDKAQASSNTFTDAPEGSVSFTSGNLLVILSRDKTL